MRIGIIGGTFNPIHNAHIICAEAAQNHCLLDKIIFVPAYIPPHKEVEFETPFEIRCEMVEAAITAYPSWELSKIEQLRGGKSYTVDTVKLFQNIYKDSELFFIIGSDSYLEISTWRYPEKIFETASLIVISRPGFIVSDKIKPLPVAIADEFKYSASENKIVHKSGNQIYFIEEREVEISSTRLRKKLTLDEEIEDMVPPAVEEYIKKRGLYTK